jgi:hypothetical protein
MKYEQLSATSKKLFFDKIKINNVDSIDNFCQAF